MSHDAANALVARPPTCPRCGYDLAGAVASWHDACPLEGVCSECGLAFRWRRIVRGVPLPWLFECPGDRPGWYRFSATVLRALRPARFWSSIDLATPLNPPRLVCFWALSVITMLVGYTLLHMLAAWSEYGWINLVGEVVSTIQTSSSPAADVTHLFRELLPFGSRFGPSLLHIYIPALLPIALITTACTALAALVPLLLNETLAEVRVRRIHIVRAAAYSVPFGCVSAMAWAWFLPIGNWLLLVGSSSINLGFGVVAITASALVTAWWWRSFARHYLRIPHAWGVALASSAVGFLLALAVLSWIRILD